MDELPSTFKIRDVSHNLSRLDISGMTGVGTFSARHLQRIIENAPNVLTTSFGNLSNDSKLVPDNLSTGFQFYDSRNCDRESGDKSLMALSCSHADHRILMTPAQRFHRDQRQQNLPTATESIQHQRANSSKLPGTRLCELNTSIITPR
jgi:hypothetical protein